VGDAAVFRDAEHPHRRSASKSVLEHDHAIGHELEKVVLCNRLFA
jgi:hypothetical protein